MSNFQNLGDFGDNLFSKRVLELNALILVFSHFVREHNFVSIILILLKKDLNFFSIDTLSNIKQQ